MNNDMENVVSSKTTILRWVAFGCIILDAMLTSLYNPIYEGFWNLIIESGSSWYNMPYALTTILTSTPFAAFCIIMLLISSSKANRLIWLAMAVRSAYIVVISPMLMGILNAMGTYYGVFEFISILTRLCLCFLLPVYCFSQLLINNDFGQKTAKWLYVIVIACVLKTIAYVFNVAVSEYDLWTGTAAYRFLENFLIGGLLIFVYYKLIFSPVTAGGDKASDKVILNPLNKYCIGAGAGLAVGLSLLFFLQVIFA